VIDGPFAETKELITGCPLIQVKSNEAPFEQTRRIRRTPVGSKEGEIGRFRGEGSG
jgi:hypothetical protein